jgi:hypothetical protein
MTTYARRLEFVDYGQAFDAAHPAHCTDRVLLEGRDITPIVLRHADRAHGLEFDQGRVLLADLLLREGSVVWHDAVEVSDRYLRVAVPSGEWLDLLGRVDPVEDVLVPSGCDCPASPGTRVFFFVDDVRVRRATEDEQKARAEGLGFSVPDTLDMEN